MGVPGLWTLLEPTGQPVSLESLEGKRLAIDVSLWLHQAAEGYLRHETPTGGRNPHLALLIHRISKLLYYKVRPVFVFDGDRVPVFKQQLLRERRLKQHMEEMTVSREQHRILSTIIDNQRESSPKKKLPRKATTEREELFALPSTSGVKDEATTNVSDSTDMGTFVESLSADDRIRLLLDSRDHARNERLTPAQIPNDSQDFSHFQMKRLLQRNKITLQLDMLCKEKEQQYAKPFTKCEESQVMFDAGNRGHMLTRHEEVQIINPEQEERKRVIKDSLSWPAILEQMREEYEGRPEPKPSTSSQIERMEVDSSSGQSSGDDNAFQEAILQSLHEEQRFKVAHGSSSFVFPFSKTSAIEETTKKIAGSRAKAEAIQRNKWSESSDSDDFVDVPDLPPSSSLNLPSFIAFDVPSDPKPSTSQQGQSRENEEGVYADCQKLLELCGIPYVLAPGEAEAQCAELEKLGLVDGVVTDDSDIWLFGGNTIYRNMFNQKKRVQKYGSGTVKEVFGLTKPEFIQLAMLSGGDYSRGFDGVGIVTALELIAEFASAEGNCKGLEVLTQIRQWLDSKAGSNEKNFIESKVRIRLRRYLETNNNRDAIQKFPNEAIFDAYRNPLVDSSSERFKWGVVSFDPMFGFVWEKLGWSDAKMTAITNRAFERWSEFLKGDVRRYQTRITAFMEVPLTKLASEQRLTPSVRAQAALKKLMEKKGVKLSQMVLEKPAPKPSKSDPAEAYDSFNESDDDWLVVPSSSQESTASGSSSQELRKRMVTIANKKFDISTVAKLHAAVKDLETDVKIPESVEPRMLRVRKKPTKKGATNKKKKVVEEEEELKLSEDSED
ncbi:hypothetical protein L596_015434 [Steinernema carpocapsae]|uniref:XPG-I domain-containing protein n=1 Tax=Steinernema carpocapsae TaxID=34508 RepID=A0A4U5NF58_STECR|nr:hypothetical protein L596_015434 [Steinernema carpocapsae]